MDDIKDFQNQVQQNIKALGENEELKKLSREWHIASGDGNYVYNFSWMGMPIIQLPQDIMAMQEIIFQVQPDLIVETGIARGGSLIFYASMLELLNGGGEVLGIDIDIRAHNYERIIKHPMYKHITMIEGSSIEEATADKVRAFAENKKRILVCLDSHHTHQHVLQELELYAPLVTKDSYCIVFDTCVEDLPEYLSDNRPWGHGNSPKSAVFEFLESHTEFEIDKSVEDKIVLTSSPSGYLKKVR